MPSRAWRREGSALSTLRHRDSYEWGTFGIVGSRYRVPRAHCHAARDATFLPVTAVTKPAAQRPFRRRPRSSQPRPELPTTASSFGTAPDAPGSPPGTRRPGWTAGSPGAPRPSSPSARLLDLAPLHLRRGQQHIADGPPPRPPLGVPVQRLPRAPRRRVRLPQVARQCANSSARYASSKCPIHTGSSPEAASADTPSRPTARPAAAWAARASPSSAWPRASAAWNIASARGVTRPRAPSCAARANCAISRGFPNWARWLMDAASTYPPTRDPAAARAAAPGCSTAAPAPVGRCPRPCTRPARSTGRPRRYNSASHRLPVGARQQPRDHAVAGSARPPGAHARCRTWWSRSTSACVIARTAATSDWPTRARPIPE
ncbi:hypothetical protein SCYAM73S_07495 [Streptomyces cyaneofuscatus]